MRKVLGVGVVVVNFSVKPSPGPFPHYLCDLGLRLWLDNSVISLIAFQSQVQAEVPRQPTL